MLIIYIGILLYQYMGTTFFYHETTCLVYLFC